MRPGRLARAVSAGSRRRRADGADERSAAERSERRISRQTWEKTMQPMLRTARAIAWATLCWLFPALLWAQGTSPWVDAVNELQAQFTGPIARGLSLIAIVVGGLMFAFGEGGSKRTLAGIIFGLGMAMGAANFLAWLF